MTSIQQGPADTGASYQVGEDTISSRGCSVSGDLKEMDQKKVH